MDIWKVGFGLLRFWESGILGKWYFGKVVFWKSGILGKWDFVKM